MYHGEKGTIRIQREPIHIHDDLQRISFIDFLKRIHVSLINTFNNISVCNILVTEVNDGSLYRSH